MSYLRSVPSWKLIRLEQSDMVEYNQCQATLKTLYELGIPGHVEEFTAYRILMLLHGRNRSGVSKPSVIFSARLLILPWDTQN